MKRLALLLALLLFLSGCDLRNRRPSEEFISDGSVPPAQARTSAPAAPPAQTGFLPAEWDGAVKTVLAKEGTFFGAKEIAYSYRIPFLDLADAYAMGCNQEITARFEADAQKSLAQMEQGKPPVVQRVDFTSDLHGTPMEGKSRFAALEMPYGPIWKCSASLAADFKSINGHESYTVNALT